MPYNIKKNVAMYKQVEGFLQHIAAALLLYNTFEKIEQKQNSPLSFRLVGTEGQRGASALPNVFAISVNPIYIKQWDRLCQPHYYVPPKFSDILTALLTKKIILLPCTHCTYSEPLVTSNSLQS